MLFRSEALGHGVVAATGTAQALEMAADADAALVDYNLDDGEDGLALADALRRARPGMAIAMITAESGAALKRKAQRRGIAFFTKPVDPAALEAFLASASVREVEA